MGLFIIGGKLLPENKCLDLAEELVERKLVTDGIDPTLSRLQRWRQELSRCIHRGSQMFGYLLEQYEGASTRHTHHRTGAYCVSPVADVDLGTPEVLKALLEISKAIHRDDIPTCDDWLFETLGASLKQSLLFESMSAKERRELTGIAKSAIRHLQHYKHPIFTPSEEFPSILFITEQPLKEETKED